MRPFGSASAPVLSAWLLVLVLAWLAGCPRVLARPMAERIITLSPHATELVFQLGRGAHIVGTVEYSDYPAPARSIPRVGGYNTISLERIAALTPDLVITWPSGQPAVLLQSLERRGVRLLATDPQHLQDIAADLRRLGKALGVAERGESEARTLETRLEHLRSRHAGARPLRVFYEVWDSPLYTLGGQHFFNDLLAVCRGENLFADVQSPSPVVSMEAVIARNPEVILSGARDGQREGGDWRSAWKRWTGVAAVRNGHLFQVDPDIFTRPTGRAAEAASSLCSLLESARTPQ